MIIIDKLQVASGDEQVESNDDESEDENVEDESGDISISEEESEEQTSTSEEDEFGEDGEMVIDPSSLPKDLLQSMTTGKEGSAEEEDGGEMENIFQTNQNSDERKGQATKLQLGECLGMWMLYKITFDLQ